MTLLCVVSLLLAAAMFPATGFGDYPDWSPSGVAPGGSDAPETGPGTGGDDSSGGGTATGDGGTATPESGTTTDAGGETTGVTTDETTGEKGTTTTTDTTSTTTTSTTTDDATVDDSDDEALLGGLWSLVGTLLAALLLGLVALAMFGPLVGLALELLGPPAFSRAEALGIKGAYSALLTPLVLPFMLAVVLREQRYA